MNSEMDTPTQYQDKPQTILLKMEEIYDCVDCVSTFFKTSAKY